MMRAVLLLGAALALLGVLFLMRDDGDAVGRAGPRLPPKMDPPRTGETTAELLAPKLPPAKESASTGEGPRPPASPGAGQRTPGGRSSGQPEVVRLFEHPFHSGAIDRGKTWILGLGTTEAGTAFDTDSASAVEVPDGLRVTLFDGPGESGYKLTLSAGRHNLAPYGFNDRTSSVRVARSGANPDLEGPEDVVELFEHRGEDRLRRGLVWRLELPHGKDEWLFSAARRDFQPQTVSTAWVPPGYELILLESIDGLGPAVVLGPGLHELDLVDFNDRANAARVRRLRGARSD